jgi:hypothetical protein
VQPCAGRIFVLVGTHRDCIAHQFTSSYFFATAPPEI